MSAALKSLEAHFPPSKSLNSVRFQMLITLHKNQGRIWCLKINVTFDATVGWRIALSLPINTADVNGCVIKNLSHNSEDFYAGLYPRLSPTIFCQKMRIILYLPEQQHLCYLCVFVIVNEL